MVFRRVLLSILGFTAAASCAAAARAETTVQVSFGSGEIQQWVTSTGVDSDTALTFRWWTTDPGVTGGRWDVEQAGSSTPIATGVLTGAPTAQHPAIFLIPAGTFLKPQAPASALVFNVHVAALQGSAAGAPSAPVVITEAQQAPVSFGNLPSSPPPVAYIEPGHPTATLVAYKPIPAEPVNGRQEGLVALEFSNPGSSPTDAVFVTISDLKQVMQQTDKQVLAPSLQPGQRFRVSVAMGPFVLTNDTVTHAWPTRYAHGISLLVGTAKVNSPYVQDQQPPILTGPTAACVGDGCGSSSPPWIANLRPNLPNIDSSIGVGQDFVYTGDYNLFDVFTKKARGSIDLSSTELSSSAAPATLAIENGGAATLFKDFWYPGSSKNVNPGVLPASRYIPCDPAHPVVLGSDGKPLTKNSFSTTACINDFYDTRLTYDAIRGRFWIVTHARNQVWQGTACGTFSQSQCASANEEALRLTFAAVSNSEAPAAGFTTFFVDNLYEDWPIMAVEGDYAFFLYHNPTRVRIYDADKMTQGVLKELTPSYTAADFNSGVIRVAKHHGQTGSLTYIVSTTGSSLHVYALHAASGRPPLLSPASYKDPDGDNLDTAYDNYQAVYRGGYLYLTTDDGHRVLVHRLPVAPSANGKSVVINTSAAKKWVIKDTSGQGFNFDYSTLDVTRNGDVVVAFRASKAGTPNQVRFAVFYAAESAFRQPRTLSAPSSGGQNGGRIDLVSSAVDPADDETIWVINRDGQGTIVGSIRP